MSTPAPPPKVLVIPGHRQLYPGQRGTDRAYCECGWASPVAETAGKRREAHRQHKVDIWKAMHR